MQKVLVAEYIDDNAIDLLKKENNIEVDIMVGLESEKLLNIIGEYDALIVRSVTKVNKELFNKAKKLKIVGRAGTGVDNIDIAEATNHGVIVANTPNSNSVSACELAIGLMTSLCRNIIPANNYLKSGKWEREVFVGNELFEKTLGIIGLGRIGGLMATRMKSFGMNLIAYDPYVSDERFKLHDCKKAETLDELLAVSDIITIHTPKTKETTKIISHEEVKKLKKGVRLVNAARGGLFDEEAVAEGLESGHIQGYGLDVHEKEPRSESPLYKFDNVIVTPHIGATTYESQHNVGTQVVLQVINGLKGEIVETAVNLPSMGREEFSHIKPYIGLAEKIGQMYYQIKKDSIHVVECAYFGELADQDTSILDSSLMKGVLYPVLKEEVNYINSLIKSKQRDINFTSKTRKDKKYGNYRGAIEMKVTNTKGERVKIVGVIGENKEERLINIDNYPLDIIIAENLLLIKNDDVPGVIGNVGRILGEEKVNIAIMYVGRKENSAMMVLTVDEKVNDEAVAKLKELEKVTSVRFINLK